MPASVQPSAPTLTMPTTLSTAFQRSRSYPVASSEYANGESQRRLDAGTSRNRWRISKRLTDAQMADLVTLYKATKCTKSFYFYDPWETVPKFTMTPSGTTGRYKVVFEGQLNFSREMARNVVEISIREVA